MFGLVKGFGLVVVLLLKCIWFFFFFNVVFGEFGCVIVGIVGGGLVV